MPFCLLAIAGGGVATADAMAGAASLLPSVSAVATMGPPLAIGAIVGVALRPAFPGEGRLMTRTSPDAVAADATVVYSHSDRDITVRNPDGSSKELGQQREEIERAQNKDRDKVRSIKKSKQRGQKEDQEEAQRTLDDIHSDQ